MDKYSFPASHKKGNYSVTHVSVFYIILAYLLYYNIIYEHKSKVKGKFPAVISLWISTKWSFVFIAADNWAHTLSVKYLSRAI